MRRIAIAVALVAAALSAPAVAQADLLEPGSIGTAAKTRMDAETFALDPDEKRSAFWSDRADGGPTAQSAYRWPPSPWSGPAGLPCGAGGCTGFNGRAFGGADVAAGELRAAAIASMYLGNNPADGYGLAGYMYSDGAAAIADTITLSQAATVILRGTIEGALGGSKSNDDQIDPDAALDVSLLFRGDEWVCEGEVCELELFGGHSHRYEAATSICEGAACLVPGDVMGATLQHVDDSFEVAVPLPAGTSKFNAELKAAIDFQVNGVRNRMVTKSAGVLFANEIEFEIEVPAHVVASSGSGLLPIVGGSPGNDTTPPTVVAPADVSESAAAESCGASVAIGTATASDDRPGVTVAASRSDGQPVSAAYPVGTTVVTWTATDAAGNTATATQSVEIADDQAPSVVAPAGISVANDPGQASALVAAGSATAADNCPGVTVAGVRSDGQPLSAPYPVGSTQITWTAVDASGNSASASQTVQVLDQEAPVLTVAGGGIYEATSPDGVAVSYSASASDNVGVAGVSCAPASGSVFPIGSTTVTCTATDAAGNQSQQSLVVVVRGAGDQLNDLLALLGAHRSLYAKARAAQAALSRGQVDVACHDLAALLNEVDAQDGRQLTPAEAVAIRAVVSRIRTVLGC